MGLLSRLFGSKKSNKNYNQVSTFVENVETMDDCRTANTMINELGLSFDKTKSMREQLCDSTFEIFAKDYPKK